MAKRERRLTKRERKATAGGAAPEFEARLRAMAAAQDRPVRIEKYDGQAAKMSEILLEWGAPLLEPFAHGDPEVYRRVLMFAATIWNEATDSVEPAEVVADQIVRRASDAGTRDVPSIRELIADLVADRRDVYGDDRRVIVQADASDSLHERRVSVAASAT